MSLSLFRAINTESTETALVYRELMRARETSRLAIRRRFGVFLVIATTSSGFTAFSLKTEAVQDILASAGFPGETVSLLIATTYLALLSIAGWVVMWMNSLQLLSAEGYEMGQLGHIKGDLILREDLEWTSILLGKLNEVQKKQSQLAQLTKNLMLLVAFVLYMFPIFLGAKAAIELKNRHDANSQEGGLVMEPATDDNEKESDQ